MAWVIPADVDVMVQYMDIGKHEVWFNAYVLRGSEPAQRYAKAHRAFIMPDPYRRRHSQNISAVLERIIR